MSRGELFVVVVVVVVVVFIFFWHVNHEFAVITFNFQAVAGFSIR